MYIKVYCILAHKNPEQIEDLISLLQDENSLFFIHLDKKENKHKYKAILEKKNCFFVKERVVCTWGKYSLVQATLNTMKEVRSFININYPDADYHFIMLSGEDLPVKNVGDINSFLESNKEKSFIHHWELPSEKWWNGGLFRLENLYFFEYKKYSKWNYRINKIIKKLKLNFLIPFNRFKKHFPNSKVYGNSQWMILTKDLVSFILNQNLKNPKFNSVFKYVLAPDEMYFASLILNFDINNQFKIDNAPLHLVLFKGADPSPKYIEIEDLNKSNIQNVLFARKFDPAVNQSAIEFIKKEITE